MVAPSTLRGCARLRIALTVFAAALLAIAAPQAQSAPDAVTLFNKDRHGLGYYQNIAAEVSSRNSLRTANAALHNELYVRNQANNNVMRETLSFNTLAAGLRAHSAISSLYTTLDAITSKTAVQTNYIAAVEHYGTVIAGPNNQNRNEVAAAAQRIRSSAQLIAGSHAASAQNATAAAANVTATATNINRAAATYAGAIANLPVLRDNQTAAQRTFNTHLVTANAYRDLIMYTGRINAEDQSVETPAIAAYNTAATRNNSVLITGGLIGAYGGTSTTAQNITNAIHATVFSAAKDQNADVAAASHDFENHLHNISRARFAANDTANNSYKAALNTVANTAEINFAARDSSTPLTTAETALRAAYNAWNQNDTTRNNALLQGNLSNAAKVVSDSNNADVRNAVGGLFNVELAAAAESATSDSEFTTEEFALAGALINLGLVSGFKGSETSRNAAYDLHARQASLNTTTVQAALSSAAFTAFNTAYAASASDVEAAITQLDTWYSTSGPSDTLAVQFAAATLVMERQLVQVEHDIVSAQEAIATATTALTTSTTRRDNALSALVANVVALTGNDATPYATHIATINSTTATTEQKAAARLAIATEVNNRATDFDSSNDPSPALAGLSATYQAAKNDYAFKFRAKAQADVDHYNFLVTRRDTRRALASYKESTNRILGLEAAGSTRVKLGNLSRALRGADENQLGTADHDKPIAILDVSLDLHSRTRSAAASVEASLGAHISKLTALNETIAENNRLIERNKAAITAPGQAYL